MLFLFSNLNFEISIFTERLRLSLRPVDRADHDRRLFDLRTPLVRRRHRLVHQPRQVPHQGIRMLCTRRKATILGNKVWLE
jgi:hypothetical protein